MKTNQQEKLITAALPKDVKVLSNDSLDNFLDSLPTEDTLHHLVIDSNLARIDNCATVELRKFTVNESVKIGIINESAFYANLNLNEINIYGAVTKICRHAFLGNLKLQSVIISASCQDIDDPIFERTALQWIILPDKFCSEAERNRLKIRSKTHCIPCSEVARFVMNELDQQSTYSFRHQCILFRLARRIDSDLTTKENFTELAKCSVHAVFKALQYRFENSADYHDIEYFLTKRLGYGTVESRKELQKTLADLLSITSYQAHLTLSDFLNLQLVCKTKALFCNSFFVGRSAPIQLRQKESRNTHWMMPSAGLILGFLFLYLSYSWQKYEKTAK